VTRVTVVAGAPDLDALDVPEGAAVHCCGPSNGSRPASRTAPPSRSNSATAGGCWP